MVEIRPSAAPVDRPGRNSSFLVTVWSGVAVVCLAIVGLFAWSALEGRQRAMQAATARVANLASILEGQTARMLGEVDLLMRIAAQEAASGSASGVTAAALRDPDRIAAIALLDPVTGRLVRHDGRGSAALAELYAQALQSHAEPATGALTVTDPVRDEAHGTWVFGLSRRILEPARGLDVIALAVVDTRIVGELYERVDVGLAGSVGLVNERAILLGRRPHAEGQIGRRLDKGPIFRAPYLDRIEGTFLAGDSAIDRVARIVAFRRLPEFRLTLAAAVGVDEVLAPWRREATTGAIFVPISLAVLVGFGALLTREGRRRGEAEAQARQESAMLEATLQNMDQGLMMVDENLRVQVHNRRALELLDLPAEFLRARPHFYDVTRHQFRTGDFDNADEAFRQWVAAGGLSIVHHSYERERPNGVVLEIRTVPLESGGAVRTYTDITARKQAERRIEHMARHDGLTGLANRVFYRERLEAALRHAEDQERAIAVLCLDLDQFKAVNDTLGHSTGDGLLKEVAHRIMGEVRPRDHVARLGGDEFAILQVGVAQPEGAQALASRLVELLGRPFVVDGHVLNIGASVGIALSPTDGRDADGLMKNADLALYKAKGDGRGTFRFFESAMDREMQIRRSVELDLREALQRDQLELHYQPLLDLARDEIVGFEALLRWRHPERGFVSPAQFIPIAEETGLIVPIGEWVLRQACAEAARWPEGLRVAVNVSAMQFRQRNLVQSVMSALAGVGLSAERLELEITESVLMQESEASVRVLHQLRALGVRIAMDDFGTGYSSLSYLRRFPFDKIKIDRAFVKELSRDSESAAIVRTIVGLGRSLGISTTAEGVETPEQLEIVRAEGCTEMQGYLLSAPKPAAEALAVLRRRAVA